MSETISSGYQVFGSVVSGETLTVDGTGEALLFTVQAGGTMSVLNGGLVFQTTVDAGGLLELAAGGEIDHTLISGGIADVTGGLAVGTTLQAGGTMNATGGVIQATTVSNGGTLNVSNSGTAQLTIISAGGIETVGSGGTDDGAIVNAAGLLNVDGGSDTGATVSAGGAMDVQDGGTAFDTVISGGTVNVENGGNTSGATVLAGGNLIIDGTSFDTGATVDAGGTETVYGGPSGGVALYTAIDGGAVDALSGGYVVSAALNSGGSLDVNGAGTTAFNAMVNSGTVSVENGGTASNTTLGGPGAQEIVGSGGAAYSTTVLSGGQISVNGGNTSYTVLSGGTEIIEAGIATDTTVLAGATEFIYGGDAFGTTISAGGSTYVYEGGTAGGADVLAGGNLYVSDGGEAIGTTVSSGGTETIGAANAVTETSLLSGGVLDLSFLTYSAGETAILSGSVLEVLSGGQVIYSQNLGSTYAHESFTVTDAPGDGIDVTAETTVCYTAGTRILTVAGEVPVEALRVGDLLVTLSGRGAALKPVRWIGRRFVDIARHPEPRRVQPVRILAGAFGDGLPHRDLLVSPGHTLFLDGVLIPAEYLVNGATVLREERRTSVEYFHIELDVHDIVLAERLPAETYIDCGNRGFFAEAAGVTPLHGVPDTVRAGELPEGYCAPWVNTGAPVAAARQLLHERALALGWSRRTDPDIRLHADGNTIAPASNADGIYRFILPTDTSSLTLLSHPGVPAEIDATPGDPRKLGLAVSKLTWRPLDGGAEITIAPDHGSLTEGPLSQGWYHLEHFKDGRPFRWTNGAARLPQLTAGELIVEVVMTRTGWHRPATPTHPLKARAA